MVHTVYFIFINKKVNNDVKTRLARPHSLFLLFLFFSFFFHFEFSGRMDKRERAGIQSPLHPLNRTSNNNNKTLPPIWFIRIFLLPLPAVHYTTCTESCTKRCSCSRINCNFYWLSIIGWKASYKTETWLSKFKRFLTAWSLRWETLWTKKSLHKWVGFDLYCRNNADLMYLTPGVFFLRRKSSLLFLDVESLSIFSAEDLQESLTI